MSERVKDVGVCVILPRWNPKEAQAQILVGRRGNDCQYGKGLWALPSGKPKSDETIIDCAIREVFEETSICVSATDPFLHSPAVVGVTDLADRRNVSRLDRLTLWVIVNYVSGTEMVREPDKCSQWKWVSVFHLESAIPECKDTASEQYAWLPYDLLKQWCTDAYKKGLLNWLPR